MSELADAVLPLIRTRADLHRWSASNAHGSQMHEAVALVNEAARTGDPAVVFSVTQRAIASDRSTHADAAARAHLDLRRQAARRAGPPWSC